MGLGNGNHEETVTLVYNSSLDGYTIGESTNWHLDDVTAFRNISNDIGIEVWKNEIHGYGQVFWVASFWKFENVYQGVLSDAFAYYQYDTSTYYCEMSDTFALLDYEMLTNPHMAGSGRILAGLKSWGLMGVFDLKDSVSISGRYGYILKSIYIKLLER